MLDPMNMTVAQRPQDKEYLAVFAVCVAGKTAATMAGKVRELLAGTHKSPFAKLDLMRRTGTLEQDLRGVRIGQYKRVERALSELCQLDAKKDLTVENLEDIPGIGPKTARFIVMYTDPKARVAALDTHILKWLGKRGYAVPKTTPPAGPIYKRLEQAFLKECDIRGKTPQELDTEIWQANARKPKKGKKLCSSRS